MNFIDVSDSGRVLNDENLSLKNAMHNIIMTPVGSMPGHPEFGSNISKYIFKLMNPLTNLLISKEITYALERWEPRIKVKDIRVDEDPDYNKLVISVIYIVLKSPNESENIYKFSIKK